MIDYRWKGNVWVLICYHHLLARLLHHQEHNITPLNDEMIGLEQVKPTLCLAFSTSMNLTSPRTFLASCSSRVALVCLTHTRSSSKASWNCPSCMRAPSMVCCLSVECIHRSSQREFTSSNCVMMRSESSGRHCSLSMVPFWLTAVTSL